MRFSVLYPKSWIFFVWLAQFRRPSSQTTWSKVNSNCNHRNHLTGAGPGHHYLKVETQWHDGNICPYEFRLCNKCDWHTVQDEDHLL
eukprot:992465-Pelagomonas_calceolata.AAC.1